MMSKQSPKDKLIVALDVDTFEEARGLIDALSSVVDIFKVGSQLFTACGPVVVGHLLARGKKVFLDLKFHDIPHTVGCAVAAAVGIHPSSPQRYVGATPDFSRRSAKTGHSPNSKFFQGIFMYTLHTQGGEEMLKAAAKTAARKAKELGIPKPLSLGVTVLTSDEKKDNINQLVLERARLAKVSGLDGVVASAREAQMLRRELGKDFIIVTPGIRSKDSEAGDQKRVMTAAEAIREGSDFLVIGRPIVKASHPQEAAQKILDEISRTNSSVG